MNDRQNANLNMFQAVSNVLEAQKSKFENVVVINTAATDLKTKIGLIREADKSRQETHVKAASAEKQNTEDDLMNQTLMVARITNVYAFDTKNQSLILQTSITKSQFYNAQANEKVSMARIVLNKAKENELALKDYGLESRTLNTLTATLEAYEQLVVKPRDVITERKGQTVSMAQLFAETKSLLNDRMDKLITLYKESDPSFYDAYFSARSVINTSYRKENTGDQNSATA